MKNTIPETGFMRLPQIIGDPEKNIPAIIPVKKTTWWEGCKTGRFPAPVKLGSRRITAWKAEDIRALVESFKKESDK